MDKFDTWVLLLSDNNLFKKNVFITLCSIFILFRL